ncbi:protein phosphatase CheZ [Kiloniella laminariae]|uniref:Protein phosphatase CheZ n=1 Tax=Kiloniella laminariae TaxID=454162 RepID=A0ABT4LEU2_9PROT|nr:protein phosphatase CheZ [Kiloniella laminariae]MCZ4279628.1 protein phosphatase CheZ [Kiloniella laminariae]
MAPSTIDIRLRQEVDKLIMYMDRLRQELADTSRKKGERTDFENMSVQLDALVRNTEEASDQILKASEGVLDIVDDIRAEADEAVRNDLCDKITAYSLDTLEACSFQDLTGQRVTKILQSLQFVEDRVNAMISIFGQEAIIDKGAAISAQEEPDDEVSMDGPAIVADEAISQDDIDALFD